jgi:hypothetical protein
MNRPARVLLLALLLASAAVVPLGAAATATSGTQGSGTVRASVVYPGYGARVWRASGQIHRLSATTKPFRTFVRRQLDRMYRASGSDPACAQAPMVQVKEFRRRVAYISNEGVFPGGPGHAPERCASGGNYAFWVFRDGRWRAPYRLGGQDVMSCSTLRHWHIPRMSGATECYDGTSVVAYHP